MRSSLLISAFIVVSGVAAAPANARPLDKKNCNILSGELAELTRQDVPKAIVNGPTWTLAHMPPETVGRVRRYLVVEEQLRFRCHGKKPPVLEPEPGKALKTATGEKQDGKAGGKETETTSALVLEKPEAPEGEGSTQADDVSAESPPAVSKPKKTRRRAVPRKSKTAEEKRANSSLDAAYRQLFPLGR